MPSTSAVAVLLLNFRVPRTKAGFTDPRLREALKHALGTGLSGLSRTVILAAIEFIASSIRYMVRKVQLPSEC